MVGLLFFLRFYLAEREQKRENAPLTSCGGQREKEKQGARGGS